MIIYNGRLDYYLIVLFLIGSNISILLDIPILRQLLALPLLSIIPGYLLLKILKLNKIDTSKKFVLSIGLSISILLFLGLLINSLFLAFGYLSPLSLVPLLASIDIVILSLVLISYFVDDGSFSLPRIHLDINEKAVIILPILFIALSLMGISIMNQSGNNFILMFLLFLIPIYVLLICIFSKKTSNRIFPLVIFLISISLLQLFALRTNHIIGVDTHFEYYHYHLTIQNRFWSVSGTTLLDACPMISLFPAIYQIILNIDQEFLFKLIFPLMVSIIPISVFLITKKYVYEKYALLSAFFIMSQYIFTYPDGRTAIAILIFCLSIMVLFSEDISQISRRFLFIFFIFTIILSHYSTSYIFLFLLLMVYLASLIFKRFFHYKPMISLTTVILLFSFIFFWYSHITKLAFDTGIIFFARTVKDFNNLFIKELTGPTFQEGVLGVAISSQSIPFQLEFILRWIIFIVIAIGVIFTVFRYKNTVKIPEFLIKKTLLLKKKIEIEYGLFALTCSAILVLSVAIPHISTRYGIERIFNMTSIILSLFFILGCIVIANIFKIRPYLLVLLIIIPYFLCSFGPIYNVFDEPRSFVLNSEGKLYDMVITHDSEESAALWLQEFKDRSMVYSDSYGKNRLISQGFFTITEVKSNLGTVPVLDHGYVFLRYYNVVERKFGGSNVGPFDLTYYSNDLDIRNNIYSTGASEIYKHSLVIG